MHLNVFFFFFLIAQLTNSNQTHQQVCHKVTLWLAQSAITVPRANRRTVPDVLEGGRVVSN